MSLASSNKRRRVLQRCTSLEQEADGDVHMVAGCRAGIHSLEDMAEWPLDVASSLCAGHDSKNEELRLRLRNHMLAGLVLNTDYSGLDCPREALEMGVCALKHELGLELPDQVLRVGRTCDKGQLQKRVQVEMARVIAEANGSSRESQAGQQHCHFEDILHRLPENAQRYIAAATPPKTASKADRMAAFASISDWVMQNRSWLFSKDAESHCCVHNRPVPFGSSAVLAHSLCMMRGLDIVSVKMHQGRNPVSMTRW